MFHSLAALALAVSAATSPAAPPPTPAPVPLLTADEIVKKASAQLEHKPKKLVCTVNIKAMQLDSSGKPTETQESELTESWIEGIPTQALAYKRALDGKPLTAEEMTKANEQEQEKRKEMKEHEQKGEGGSVEPPFATAQVARHKFALLRKDKLEGREVYVLSVEPVSQVRDERYVTRAGTAYIDAETFVPLHIETVASPLPKHVEKMQFDETFTLSAQGETIPNSLALDMRGGFLVFVRSYRVETRWHDCK